jgi:tellurite methyltransferase
MTEISEEQEQAKWNRRYREGTHGSAAPDSFLVEAYDRFIEPLFPNQGTALDIAGGAGRHAIYLASRGWNVRMLDIAGDGIANAHLNAGCFANQIQFEVCDLSQFKASHESYELVLVFFFLPPQQNLWVDSGSGSLPSE